MRIYLDTAPIIYLVEGIVPYASVLEARLAQPEVTPICSELSRLECRVKPLRDGQHTLLAAIDSYFTELIAEMIPLSRQVIDKATQLRARYGLRIPDAIHLAAAATSGCDLFLTNDLRLGKCSEVPVEVIQGSEPPS